MFYIEQGDLKYNGGCIQYIVKEYSFNSTPILPSLPAIQIQNLSLTFDYKSKEANDIWGYHNYKRWVKSELKKPDYVKGKLILLHQMDKEEICRIENANGWYTFYDINTGWICIGNNAKRHGKFDNSCNGFIEFYPNVIADIQESELNAIWIKPIVIGILS